jgi:HlyD family secretion protein
MRHFLVLVAVAVCGLIAYTRYADPPRLAVKTVAVQRGTVWVTVSTVFTGAVASEREATLSFQTAGTLASVAVREGDVPAAGAIVARLDDSEARAQVRLAEANLHAAQAQLQRAKLSAPLEDAQVRAEISQSQAHLENAATVYRRWQELFAKGAVARQQVEDAQMRYDLAKSRHEMALAAVARNAAKRQEIAAAEATVAQMEAALAMARLRLDQTVLRTPFAGLVAQVYGHAGEFVGPGKPILHLVDPTGLYVKAVVDEADALKVRVGQRARVIMDAFRGHTFGGRVREISPVISAARQESRTSEVKIALDEGALPIKPGLSADIEIIVQEVPDVLMLPTHVILEREGGRYIYVVTDGRVQERPIRVGASNWDFTEVSAGVREGERVILPVDGAKLEDGRPVQVVD